MSREKVTNIEKLWLSPFELHAACISVGFLSQIPCRQCYARARCRWGDAEEGRRQELLLERWRWPQLLRCWYLLQATQSRLGMPKWMLWSQERQLPSNFLDSSWEQEPAWLLYFIDFTVGKVRCHSLAGCVFLSCFRLVFLFLCAQDCYRPSQWRFSLSVVLVFCCKRAAPTNKTDRPLCFEPFERSCFLMDQDCYFAAQHGEVAGCSSSSYIIRKSQSFHFGLIFWFGRNEFFDSNCILPNQFT